MPAELLLVDPLLTITLFLCHGGYKMAKKKVATKKKATKKKAKKKKK